MRAFLTFTLLLVAGAALAEEKLIGTNADLRTILAFKVSEAAAQKLLSDGWEVNSPSTGPAKGSNLTVVLDEEVTSFDPDGKPVATFRGAALSVPAKKKGTNTTGAVVVGGYFDVGAPGKFGVYTSAEVNIERKAHTNAQGMSTVQEIWQIKASDGSSIEAQIEFVRGLPERRKIESRLFSPVKPEVAIVYHIDQATDVVRSTAAGVDRVTQLSFKASGGKLTTLFDGSEQLISVTSVPWYSRQVYSLGP
jgi:hypothetical protein